MQQQEMPIMCSGCKGFFAKGYKARHQVNCLAAGTNVMVPVVSLTATVSFENYPDGFKELLSDLQQDDTGNCVKTDSIILMLGFRSYTSLKRRKGKVIESRKTVRTRMRLLARVYLKFKSFYTQQSEVRLTDVLNNARDVYRRETTHVLCRAIEELCEQEDEELKKLTITGQKSGLKLSILNLLKLTGDQLVGYFLV